MDCYIVEVTGPTQTDPSPSWLLESSYAMACKKAMSIVGSTAQLDTPTDVVQSLALQDNVRKVHLVALTGTAPAAATVGELGFPVVAADDDSWPRGDVVAEFWGDAALNENTELIDGEITVSPTAPEAGALMLQAMETATGALSRNTILSWSWHRGGADVGTDATLNSPTGEGAIPDDLDAAMHVRAGYRLTSIERQSALLLPVSDERLNVMWERGQRALTDYDVEVGEGPLAESDVEAMATLLGRLAADSPHDGVDVEVEQWDADRVAEWESTQRSDTRIRILATVRDRSTGQLVGYSQLRVPNEGDRSAAFQIGTLVLPEHRGHGLGWLLKVAALRHLQTNYPECTRIDTWNSYDNAAMLAVNVEVGYTVVSTYGCWRKDLT